MPTLACATCGEAFRVSPSRMKRGNVRFCSRECTRTGKTLVCETCGKEFRLPPSRIKRNARFCSYKCKGAAQVTAIEMTCPHCKKRHSRTRSLTVGEKAFKIGEFCSRKCWTDSRRIEKVCPQCGETFTVPPSISDQVCCGEKCTHAYFVGPNKYGWKGEEKDHKGYVIVYRPDHPNANARGYVMRARLVVEEIRRREIEKQEGRRRSEDSYWDPVHASPYLRKDEFVGHLDGNRSNDDPGNLVVGTKSYVMKRVRESKYKKDVVRLKVWDGKRSVEVARKLGISLDTVHKILKDEGLFSPERKRRPKAVRR